MGVAPDYGLYLGSARLRGRYDGGLWWAREWVEWPDFWVPKDGEGAVRSIRALYEMAGAGQRVEVACAGGVGRTGTVIACLAVLAGVPAGEAVAWARGNYHPKAVEMPWQRWWVERFPRG
ncbi:protein-tyrosine-phosphatase [Acrocarpospora corrugata]|uniref:Protein-tyrosine-phosphatase n=1 Tax=Acrocarpospora corrugata TaxID=35763 RepID=A0A5M3WFK2_9ACTN|nr:protein-tyrosine-phosphatase [Acrocarpospora corrugata]